MQHFAEIIVGMTVEEILAYVPDPLPGGKVTLSVPDPFAGPDEKRLGVLVSAEFDADGYESREDFSNDILTGCCDCIYEVDEAAEEAPTPEALQHFSETGPFQALFQFRFEEAINLRVSPPLDLHFPSPVRFAFAPAFPRHLRGHFTGDLEVDGGAPGDTAGSFRLELKRTVGFGPAEQVLDEASLYLKVYRFPGKPPVPRV